MKPQVAWMRFAVLVLASLIIFGCTGRLAAASQLSSSGSGSTISDGVSVGELRARALTKTAIAKKIASRKELGGELARARQILAMYVEQYPILAGATVEFGDARGYQAISYYQSGRIVISKDHSASVERLIGHEIWHIIDWRDNGKIDWGENVPPQ